MALAARMRNGHKLLANVGTIHNRNCRVDVHVLLIDGLVLRDLEVFKRTKTTRTGRCSEKRLGVRQGGRSHNNDVFHGSMLFDLRRVKNPQSVLERPKESLRREKLWP